MVRAPGQKPGQEALGVWSPLWTGVILVAANPRRALSNARAAICISKAAVVGGRP
jgi:hypothetical protein